MPRLVELLLMVLFAGMLNAVYCLDQVRTVVVFVQLALLTDGRDADQMLIQFTSSIVYTRLRRHDCNVDVLVVARAPISEATLNHILLQRILKVVTQHRCLIRSIAHVAMHEYNRIVIAPLGLWRVPESAIKQLYLLNLIQLADHLVNKIDHQDEHDDVPVAFEDVEGALTVVQTHAKHHR